MSSPNNLALFDPQNPMADEEAKLLSDEKDLEKDVPPMPS
jgi:hypothetical protein